jgi:hypothetical protein
MDYEIKPYQSVNDFVFGKKQSDIAKFCGKPLSTKIDNIQEIIIEAREGCELVYEEKKLAYVTLNKHVNPIVAGINVFAGDSIAQLKNLDRDFLEGPQYIVFRSLGICLGGMGKKKIPEGKIVNVFAKEKLGFFEFFVND